MRFDTLMVDLNDLVIFDPATSTLYSAKDLQMSMNGRALQITLPGMQGQALVMNAPKKIKRKKTAYSKALSKALVEENEKQRRNNGQYKKGKSAATVLKAAHKSARKMTKK